MLRSTGEGLSPTAVSSATVAGVPVLRPGRVERMRGVLEADLVPRRLDRAGPDCDGTIAGDGLGLPYRVASSSLGDAVRLLPLPREGVPSCALYASIQGLVSGDKSTSLRSPGEGRGTGGAVLNTIFAGAE